MLYTIVLNDGRELVCWTKQDHTEILKMYLTHDIFIVQENARPKFITFIDRSKVSHIVFEEAAVGKKVAM